MKKMKNKILKSITWVAAIIVATCMCMFDSETYIPCFIAAVCMAWIILFASANDWFKEEVEDV